MPEGLSSPNQDKPKKNISRRDFVAKMAAITAGLALGGKSALAETPADAETGERNTAEIREVNTKKLYHTGPLEGHTFSGNSLFYYFTGIKGKVPATVEINFYSQLEVLFKNKEDFVERKHKSNTVFKQAGRILLREYSEKSPERMNLKSYNREVEFGIEQIERNIDWRKVQDLMNLDADELKLLKDITGSILPKHLTAYALTELMPSADGDLNRDVYEFLLKNAGARYVYSVPAIYDDRLSFGPYQFTSGALMDIERESPVGASKVNMALPEISRIPGSVAKLRGVGHHKAAILFAIHNLAMLIKKLNAKELATLKSSWKHNITGITQFIATAHHAPAPAINSAKRWLDAGAKNAFEVSCPNDVYGTHQYAVKTKANLSALV